MHATKATTTIIKIIENQWVCKFEKNRQINEKVDIYVDQNLNVKVLKDYNSHDSSAFESLFIEICSGNGKIAVFGVIYLPTSENNSTFLEKFVELLFQLTKRRKVFDITEDFN